jgi:ubiquinone/menaquinone biosynthesis C-methylase UbiE
MYNSRVETDIYDILYRNHYKRHVSVFDRLIRQHKLSDNKLLDMCCGTGAHLNIYKQLGYDVTGVDLSEAMVDKAKKNVESATIVQGDMRLFLPEKKYDAITCHSFSILHNINIDDMTATFINFFNILQKNGVLVFDVLDKKAVSLQADGDGFEQISIDPDSTLFSQYGGEFDLNYNVQWNYNESRELFTVTINLRIEGQNGVTDIKENMDMGAFSIDEIISQMEDIGFDVVAFSRTFDQIRKRSDDETKAIIVATKRQNGKPDRRIQFS